MKTIILGVLGFLFSTSVAASPSEKELTTMLFISNMSARIEQAGTIGNLPNFLQMSASDKKMFVRDIEENKLQNHRLPAFRVDGLTMTTGQGSKSLTFDFQKLNERTIFINGKKLDLADVVSYSKAKMIIESVSGKSGVSLINLLLTPANAAGALPLPSQVFIAGSIVISIAASPGSNVESLRADQVAMPSIEDTIIQTYRNDLESNIARLKDDNVHYGSNKQIYYHTSTFTCENGILASMKQKVLLSEGKSVDRDFMARSKMNVTFDPKLGQYVMSNSSCKLFGKPNGDIVPLPDSEKLPMCTVRKGDFFSSGPFYQFPMVAMACCHKKGCYEKVTAALKTFQAKYPVGDVENSTVK